MLLEAEFADAFAVLDRLVVREVEIIVWEATRGMSEQIRAITGALDPQQKISRGVRLLILSAEPRKEPT